MTPYLDHDPNPTYEAEAFGDPRARQERSMPVALQIPNCPQCKAALNPARPALSCPACGHPLDGSGEPIRRPVRRRAERTES